MKQLVAALTVILFWTGSVFAQPTGEYSIKFTNGDDVLNGGLETLSTSTLTVELWVKPATFQHTIFTKMNGGDYPSKNGIALEILSSSQLRLSVGRDGSRTMVAVNAALTANQWNHVAVTFNSGTATLFLNGVSKGSATGSSQIDSPYPFSFGSFPPWGSYNLDGELDDIRIFNTVRSGAQILSDMTSDKPEGALAFWKMDEGTGDVVSDASGNGNYAFFGTSNGSADANDPAWFQYNTAPDAPTALFATSNNGEVTVTWSASEAADVEGYAIYGGTTSAPETKLAETASANDTSYTFSSLNNGDFYYFRVKAFDANQALSGFSPEDAVVVAGDASRALTFDGTDDYVNLGNANELNITEDLTLEAWIYADDYNQAGRIISKWGISSGYEIDLYLGNIRFNLNQFVIMQTSITGYNGTWVHVAATKSGNTGTLYINGVSVGSGFAQSTITTSPNNLLIGRMANLATNSFNGTIDEVRIWNVARTASEIFDHYNTPLVGTESGLVGLWHLDEGTGTTAYDSTPNGNDGSHSSVPVIVVSGAMGGGTVPVELSSFTGSISSDQILLKWSTASEKNNAGWEIQRQEDRSQKSEDRINAEWETLGFVAGKGTTTEAQSYEFSSLVPSRSSGTGSPSSPAVYRLKQMDLDGTVSYSQVLTLSTSTPSDFKLIGNYPNPFNPATKISYQLPVSSEVNLQVYDVTGRIISTLVNGKKEAGVHEVSFDATGLSSGLYFYRISAGSFSAVKPMMLVK
ncbi:MAG: fibronectin type III domain-containing protein [Bacteroidetes bacterium]|nr:fibronectin type III domain-containing protein [Bacteroidota bacterium]